MSTTSVFKYEIGKADKTGMRRASINNFQSLNQANVLTEPLIITLAPL